MQKCIVHLCCGVSLLAMTTVMVGCSKPTSSPSDTSSKSDKSNKASKPLDPGSERSRGDAFGLPLPPRVLSIDRQERQIRVYTDMKVLALEKFFNNQLVDYEVIRTGNTIRAIPLRSYMPWVSVIKPWGYRDPAVVNYRLPLGSKELKAKAESGKELEPKKSAKQIRAENAKRIKERYGKPVRLKLPNGKLLAPGARWGKPYYPPKGSPLESDVENHGTPFGEWVAN